MSNIKLVADDLYHHITVTGAIKFDGKDILAFGQEQHTLLDWYRLAVPEEDCFAVRMTIRSAVGLRFPAELEEVVRVLIIYRHYLIENTHEILKQHRFIVIDRYAHSRMRDVNERLPLANTGPADDLLYLGRDIDKLDLRGAFQVDALFMDFHMYFY